MLTVTTPGVEGGVTSLTLPSGHPTFVDTADLTLLEQYRWCIVQAKHTTYVRGYRIGHRADGYVPMHGLLMSPPEGMVADHINGNGLDNRRANLRVGTRAQNNANRRQLSGPSGYRGVRPHGDRWRAYISVNNRQVYLGLFDDPWDAALAYNGAAVDAWGPFARVNVKDETC